MKIAAAVLCLILCSCEQDKGHALPRDLGAAETPLGIKVKFSGDFQGDRATALVYVDLRVTQWVSEKSLWGCGGYTDEELYAIARSELVVIYDGNCVAGDGGSAYTGYNFYKNRIEVIYDCPHAAGPGPYDPQAVSAAYWDENDPLYQLKHEWTHSALGDWHP